MIKSAKAFRRTETLTLSNGEVVEVRKPDLQKLALNAKNGEIPSFLRQQVIDGLNGIQKTSEQVAKELEDKPLQITLDNAHEYTGFFALLTKAALVWPAIKDNPTDADYENGFIALDDLSLVDQMAIATWAMPKEAQTVKSFRSEQSADVAITSDVSDVQATPV